MTSPYVEWSTSTSSTAALAYSIQSPQDWVIPLRILEYQGLAKPRTVVAKQILPLRPSFDVATDGNLISWGTTSLPRITLSGEIDTPIAALTSDSSTIPTVGNFATPIPRFGTQVISYADIIGLCLEGNILTSTGKPTIVHPDWFRDPFGRQFNNVRVEKFQASFVEAVPGRHTFSMTLRVFGNA
jgi:hypothetical protein